MSTKRSTTASALTRPAAETPGRASAGSAPRSGTSPADAEPRDINHLTTGQFLVAYIIGAVGGIAVFLHADRNGSRHATAWAIAVFLLPITVVIYVVRVYRTRRGRRW
jgi:hypothetical protein